MCTTEDDKSQKEEKLTTYCQMVNILLDTYGTDDVMAEAEADITTFN